MLTRAYKTAATEVQTTGSVTIANAVTGQRIEVAFALVTRNAGSTNHVKMKFGSRIILSSSTDVVPYASGGPFLADEGENLTIEVGAATTGNYAITWRYIPA
ncbi:MAG: hypothetical protein IT458_08495 [Planctomycetes bacterium]|nr:hypothetical protein [Planctomycetota bacterium]